MSLCSSEKGLCLNRVTNASARTIGTDFQVNFQRASTQEAILFKIYSSSSAYIVLGRQIKDEALFKLFS